METSMLNGRAASRRDVIKKALKAGGVAYVAPMVLGSVVPAAAQVSTGPNPECAAATCTTFVACNSNASCVCVSSSTGGGYCVLGATSCTAIGNCGAAPDYTCPAGSFCAINTCCNVPVCVAFTASTPCQLPSGSAPTRSSGTLWSA